MGPMLRSMDSVTEVRRIIAVVEMTRFETFPDLCWCRRDYNTVSVRLVGGGDDYLYYNVFSNVWLTENEEYHLIHWYQASISDGDTRGWDLESPPDGLVGDEEIFNSLADVGSGDWAEAYPNKHQAMGRSTDSANNNANTSVPPNSWDTILLRLHLMVTEM